MSLRTRRIDRRELRDEVLRGDARLGSGGRGSNDGLARGGGGSEEGIAAAEAAVVVRVVRRREAATASLNLVARRVGGVIHALKGLRGRAGKFLGRSVDGRDLAVVIEEVSCPGRRFTARR